MLKKHNCQGFKLSKNGAEYQDEKYGQGIRVVNPTVKGDWRCSVCGEVIKGEFETKKVKK